MYCASFFKEQWQSISRLSRKCFCFQICFQRGKHEATQSSYHYLMFRRIFQRRCDDIMYCVATPCHLVVELKILLVSEVTMVSAVYHFPPLLPSWHGCPLMSCGLVERLWLWGVPLYNARSLGVNTFSKDMPSFKQRQLLTDVTRCQSVTYLVT